MTRTSTPAAAFSRRISSTAFHILPGRMMKVSRKMNFLALRRSSSRRGNISSPLEKYSTAVSFQAGQGPYWAIYPLRARARGGTPSS